MDLGQFCALLSPAGQTALQEVMALQPKESQFLQHLTALQRRLPDPLARSALETAILRLEARQKFPQADRMYFTRPALEQATAFAVSSYRAERFRSFSQVIDLGCSIGGDSLALADAAPTLGIDLDPLRLAMARANAAALGLAHRAGFVQANLLAPLPLKHLPSTGLFFDPARRKAEKRIFSVNDYQPPLKMLQHWLPQFPALGVKISPGVDLAEIAPYPAEVEFISLKGELKEAVLWFGPLKTAQRRATILPGPFTLTQASHQTAAPALPLGQPQAYLYEPDPSILRAGLVAQLGAQLGAVQLDPDIAYLTSDRLSSTPFAQAYAVEDWLPFNLKKLRAVLRQKNIGRVTVKKRGSPLTPEGLIHDLKLKGDQERVIFLTHLQGRPIVILSTGRVEN